MGLHGFLQSSGFIDGGVTGISMLLAHTLKARLSNPDSHHEPAIRRHGATDTSGGSSRSGSSSGHYASDYRSALRPSPLSCIRLCTPTSLLTAGFGGIFLGAGMGLAMRGGAVLDGTDIAALLISKRSHVFRVGDVILGLNIVIFLEPRRRFLGGEKSSVFDPDLCLSIQDPLTF